MLKRDHSARLAENMGSDGHWDFFLGRASVGTTIFLVTYGADNAKMA